MKDESILKWAVTRLLALTLCLMAVVPQMWGQTYTVAGTANGVLGTSNNWNVNATVNDMTRYGSTTYYYLLKSGSLSPQSGDWYGFKVVTNHSWNNTSYPSDNYNYNVGSSGTYTCVFTFNTSGNKVTLTGPFQTLTVAGSHSAALGSSWSATDTDNDMTTSDEGITYTLTKSNVACTTEQYECKVCANHAWDNNGLNISYPTSGNKTYSVPENGNYDIVYTFNTITQELTVTPTLVAPVAVTYEVIGSSALFGGTDWNNGQPMTEENGTYTWETSSNIHLNAGTYEYKVHGSDNQWYPNDNKVITITTPGTYSVSIHFDGTTVTETVTLIEADQSYTYDIFVRYTGEENLDNVFIYAWDGNGTLSDAWNGSIGGTALSALTSQVINGHTYYKVTYTSYSSTINVIFDENGSSATQTANLTANPGNNYYTYGGGNTVTGPNTQPDALIVTYYVVGDDTSIFPNAWETGNGTDMTDNGDGTYTWTSGEAHLTSGTSYEFKVRGDDGSWHPTNSGNQTFNVNVPGTYTVTVTYDSNNETVTAVANIVTADPINTYDIYVRYKGEESLSNVFIYAWDANGTLSDAWNGSIGGTALSALTSQVINGHTYYKVTYTSYSSTINVIFDENGSSATQTANLTANPGDNYYTYGGGSTVTGPNAQADPITTYYVVGDDTSIFPNAWETGNGTNMTDNGDGTYTWTSGNVHLNHNENYTYKIRDNEGGWYPDGDNQTFSVNVPGTYTVTVTYDSNTGTVTAVTNLIEADPINAIYIIGNANTQQWAANAGISMEYDEETGYYSLKNVVLTAMSQFSFATILGSNSEDWATLNANRFSSDGQSHWSINENWLNQWMSTQDFDPNDDNHNWYVEKSGAYDIDFNPNTREVRVKRSHDNLYISYGVNWSYPDNSQEMTTVDGNIYQATITLNEGDYFLFSTNLSDETALGATSENYEITNLMIGFAQKLESSTDNFHFTGASGKYIAVVNLEKGTVTLRKTADATVTKIFLQKTSNVVLDPAGGTYQGQTLEGKRGGIYAWNKLNLENLGGTYRTGQNGPSNYTYEGEVVIDGENYVGNGYLKDLPDSTTVDGKEWYAWSVSNSICEFYFIRNNKTDYKSQNIMRRAGEVWLIWVDQDATQNRQDNAQHLDSLQEVTSIYYDVTASGVSDCSSMLEDHYYVYYTNTTGWDSVYCYAWREGDPFIEFTDVYPGNKCTFVGYDEDGYEVWCYDFGLMEDFHRIYGADENGDYYIPTNIIFDNGKGGASAGTQGDSEREQTGNLVFDNGACYDYLGTVYLGNSLNGIINSGIVNGPKYTVEDNLIGVYYDEDVLTKIIETDMNGNPILDENGQPRHIDVKGALYAKDFDNYSAKSIQPDGTTDYVYKICAHQPSTTYPGGSQIQLMRDRYDQSNWVKIVLSPNFDNTHLQNTDVTYDKDLFDDDDFESATANGRHYLQQYVGKIIPGGSMSGNLVNNVNPQMHITNIAMPLDTEEYEKNVYVTGHFNDTVVFSYVHQDWNPGFYDGVYRTVPHLATDENGNYLTDSQGHYYVDAVEVKTDQLYKMFYVAPKPQEIAYITWAVFDHPNDPYGIIGTDDCQEEPDEPGAFYSPMNWDRTGQLWSDPNDPYAAWGTTYGPYSNGFMQYGAFQVNWSLFGDDNNRNEFGQPWYQVFKPGQAYKILALIRYAYGDTPEDVEYTAGIAGGSGYNEGPGNHVSNAPRRSNTTWADMDVVPYKEESLNQSKFIVFPLMGNSEDSNGSNTGNVTAVKEVRTSRTVTSVRYFNLMGVESSEPFDGINIVVTTYSDGSRTSKKVLR